jgi:hypothetical protein
MALSKQAAQKALAIFHQIKDEFLPELIIPHSIDRLIDLSDWTEDELENRPINRVLGWDRKSDDGWENILIYTPNPSNELKDRFSELAKGIINSSINKPATFNPQLWCFGWF